MQETVAGIPPAMSMTSSLAVAPSAVRLAPFTFTEFAQPLPGVPKFEQGHGVVWFVSMPSPKQNGEKFVQGPMVIVPVGSVPDPPKVQFPALAIATSQSVLVPQGSDAVLKAMKLWPLPLCGKVRAVMPATESPVGTSPSWAFVATSNVPVSSSTKS